MSKITGTVAMRGAGGAVYGLGLIGAAGVLHSARVDVSGRSGRRFSRLFSGRHL